MPDKLSDREIGDLVNGYLGRSDLSESDDPNSDLARLSMVAMTTPGAKKLVDISTGGLDAEFPRKKLSFANYAMASGCFLESLNPSIASDDWERLFVAILRARYGGTYVRFKKRPKDKLLLDARRMTAKELMKIHPDISRSYAYQLRKEALIKK